jgi:hypothetical protein
MKAIRVVIQFMYLTIHRQAESQIHALTFRSIGIPYLCQSVSAPFGRTDSLLLNSDHRNNDFLEESMIISAPLIESEGGL